MACAEIAKEPRAMNSIVIMGAFSEALSNVLSTMAKIELKQYNSSSESDARWGEVSAIIGMVGPQIRGSMAISFDKKLSLAIMHNMLAEEITEITEEVSDMVGEMTNMVCGGAKAHLSEKGYQFEMATPVVVSGSKHKIQHKVEGPKMLMTFTSSHGIAYLEICFDK
jgi:chemotaxis protein CheX